jgi:hypothetical protein
MSVEEEIKALEEKHGHPMWSDEDQAHHIASVKAELAGILKGDLHCNLSFRLEKLESNFSVLHDLSLLMICIDALRSELIAWCESKR